MTMQNSYTPPEAIVVDPLQRQSKWPRYVVAALIAMQLLATIYYSGVYLELVRRGASSPIALLFGSLASVCLYVAAIVMVFSNSRGRRLFIFAAIGLTLSVPLWGWLYSWSIVSAFGAVLGLVGWRITCQIAGSN